MTQQELADRAGVDLKTIYNLESGTRWPIAKTRAAVSAALRWEGDALTAIADGNPASEPTAAPEPDAEPASPDDADAMENAVIVAALPRREREVWAEMRRSLQATPAGRDLFADPRQAALWPEGGAPVQVTPEAKAVLDSTPPDVLFTARSDVLAASLVMSSWHERVQWAAAGRALLGRPTSAVRRAG
jgi:transcriptional regulator with XRE-family HTH domain